jgi:hypothetical protein
VNNCIDCKQPNLIAGTPIVVHVRKAPKSLEFEPTEFRMCLHHGANGNNTITRKRYKELKESFKPPEIPMPWSPRSRSKEGEQTERHIAKKRGMRPHPRSGAGRIKDDASDEHTVIEVKDANKSHTINAKELLTVWKRAMQQGKEAQYVIYFKSIDMTATMTLRRGKQ